MCHALFSCFTKNLGHYVMPGFAVVLATKCDGRRENWELWWWGSFLTFAFRLKKIGQWGIVWEFPVWISFPSSPTSIHHHPPPVYTRAAQHVLNDLCRQLAIQTWMALGRQENLKSCLFNFFLLGPTVSSEAWRTFCDGLWINQPTIYIDTKRTAAVLYIQHIPIDKQAGMKMSHSAWGFSRPKLNKRTNSVISWQAYSWFIILHCVKKSF